MTISEPQPIIEKIGRFNVLRDDLFPGGTKARILQKLLYDIPHKEIVYAGHPYGYACLALAKACESHGKTATVFLPEIDVVPEPLRLTLACSSTNVITVKNTKAQPALYKVAEQYSQKNDECYLFPIGFCTSAFQEKLVEYARSLPVRPKEVWALAGSGCLVRSLKQAWADAQINGVSLGFSHLDAQGVKLYYADELPEEAAKKPPPYPSASYYDAKIWRYVDEYGSDDALIWNVA